jgi:phage-related minor tail protein
MESDNGGLNFRVGLDNSQLAADAARIKAQFNSIGDAGVAQGSRIENSFNRMTTAAAAYHQRQG